MSLVHKKWILTESHIADFKSPLFVSSFFNALQYTVDYKRAKRSGYHFKLQLCAYALLLEEHFACDITRGFLYLIPPRRAEEVVFDKKLRRTVQKALREMKAIRLSEAMPPPTTQRRRCTDCEFRKFCNGVSW
jgi:CRISPR-associated exonuclease Cas4